MQYDFSHLYASVPADQRTASVPTVAPETHALCRQHAPSVAHQVAGYAAQGMQYLEVVAGVLGCVYTGAQMFMQVGQSQHAPAPQPVAAPTPPPPPPAYRPAPAASVPVSGYPCVSASGRLF